MVSWYRHVFSEYEQSTRPRYTGIGIGRVNSWVVAVVGDGGGPLEEAGEETTT